ncbi:hypothetical protein V8C34DRAFT_188553 [Trichoderma compactum]
MCVCEPYVRVADACMHVWIIKAYQRSVSKFFGLVSLSLPSVCLSVCPSVRLPVCLGVPPVPSSRETCFPPMARQNAAQRGHSRETLISIHGNLSGASPGKLRLAGRGICPGIVRHAVRSAKKKILGIKSCFLSAWAVIRNCQTMPNHMVTHGFSFLFFSRLFQFLLDRMTHHFGSNCIATLDLHVDSQERLHLTKTFTLHSILRHFSDKDSTVQYSLVQTKYSRIQIETC